MAQDRAPVTDEELEEAQPEIHNLFDNVREALAEDIGGEPKDYDTRDRPVADAGE